MTNETKKPEDRITIQYSLATETPTSKDIFMSAGLLRRLSTVATSHASLMDLYTDASLQSYLITEVLKPRTPRGQAIEEYTLEDFNISIAEADKLSQWINEHIVDFLLTAVKRLQAAVKDKDSQLMQLAVSMTGSSDSIIENPSAGDLTANTVTSN